MTAILSRLIIAFPHSLRNLHEMSPIESNSQRVPLLDIAKYRAHGETISEECQAPSTIRRLLSLSLPLVARFPSNLLLSPSSATQLGA